MTRKLRTAKFTSGHGSNERVLLGEGPTEMFFKLGVRPIRELLWFKITVKQKKPYTIYIISVRLAGSVRQS